MTVHSSRTLKQDHESEYSDLSIRRPSGREPSFEPSSVDLHLGKYVGRFNPMDSGKVQVWDESTYPDPVISEEEKPIIWPGEFALGHTEENVTVPNGKVGFLHGRSSVGRLGLFIHNAGLVDAGFDGELTLELFNPAPYPIQLKEGMRVCQMTLHQHDAAPRVEYSTRNGNKYNGQEGPTPSRLHEDFNQ